MKADNQRFQNEDASTSSATTTSNIRRVSQLFSIESFKVNLIYILVFKIGESGKSTKELEKTISLMKKIILKLQQENEILKSK